MAWALDDHCFFGRQCRKRTLILVGNVDSSELTPCCSQNVLGWVDLQCFRTETCSSEGLDACVVCGFMREATPRTPCSETWIACGSLSVFPFSHLQQEQYLPGIVHHVFCVVDLFVCEVLPSIVDVVRVAG